MKEERIGPHRLILGDCLEVMPTLGRVDAVVTSPPYDGLRDYGPGFEGVDCIAVIQQIAQKLLDGGICVWNVADQTINGSETGSSFRQAIAGIECGLNLHDTMIYERAQAFGGSHQAYLHAFEFVFIFSQGAPKTFNALRDRKNARPGIESHALGGRRKDGTIPERKLGETQEFGKRTNVWRYGVGGEKNEHPAAMPYQLCADHVASWSNPNNTILDPFMGSGTTGVACQKLGRAFIGIELDPEYFAIACKRVDEAMRQPDLFVEPIAKPVQEQLL